MSVNDTSRNGSMPTTIEESTEPVPSHEPTQACESTVLNGRHESSFCYLRLCGAPHKRRYVAMSVMLS
jgi:hypothetical protein